MVWLIEFSDEADRDFAKLDKAIQRCTFRYLHERIAGADDPRDFSSGSRMNLPVFGATESETTASSAPLKKKG